MVTEQLFLFPLDFLKLPGFGDETLTLFALASLEWGSIVEQFI